MGRIESDQMSDTRLTECSLSASHLRSHSVKEE